MTNKKDELLLHLVTLLVNEGSKQKIIEDALAYICEKFGFDSGSIYESDQQNLFHMRESVSQQSTVLYQRFYMEDLFSHVMHLLEAEQLLYIHGESCSTPYERELLQNLNCHSCAIFPLRAENDSLHGMILFISSKECLNSAPEELEILRTLLRILGQYLSTRIYQNILNFAKDSMECILDHTEIDIYVNDFYTHEILYVNKSMAAPYGGQSAFVAQKCWQILFPGQNGQCDFCPQHRLIDEDGNPTNVYTWDYQRAFDGSWFRVFSSAFRWMNGRIAHMVCSANITDNKKNEETIAYMANYDVLTNLPNRRKLIQDFTKLTHPDSGTNNGYVLFFDIDGFKNVNDVYGHETGDELLIKLGEFFMQIPLLKEVIYRNGGDEFVALIMGEHITRDNIIHLVWFIHERFKKPWQMKKGDIFCNTSVGVSHYPQDGTLPEDLLAIADKAMYTAKKKGRGNIAFGGDPTED